MTRFRHIMSGIQVATGVTLYIVATAAAARGLKGYEDVLAYLGSICLATWSIFCGIEWSK